MSSGCRRLQPFVSRSPEVCKSLCYPHLHDHLQTSLSRAERKSMLVWLSMQAVGAVNNVHVLSVAASTLGVANIARGYLDRRRLKSEHPAE
ncbi:hypothetical protein ACKLNR_006846 [Fusarium oxysporum f. sp. zingiberi]